MIAISGASWVALEDAAAQQCRIETNCVVTPEYTI